MPEAFGHHGPMTFMSEHERGLVGGILQSLVDAGFMPPGDILQFELHIEDYRDMSKKLNISTNYDIVTGITLVEVRL